ncbi:DUF1194 domain-containing protein [Ruegeria pomeroyi]|uniref:Lipoprotein, putative n=2 Tax=Ruegeria pomeroyi TaxID=89184 RepID=Q5LTZ2_RUEPO|nr:DUF1194 domain-containing protein [Ruegeria pomeroyi]AAV94560.1 lipoprotein, putative [Ruegeria pomeroyi DSS-3]NVK99206.1 DUF1194 domain-containing protein [Ruegeria pomeroyi]NVL03438.1 DUF1194 domain-containing protein [Ruegeria pomeroyi]QWV08144.1 DUF1194 domain-containing protein [Ruegeria pomeroyi]
MIRLLTLLALLLPVPGWAGCRQALALGLDVSGSVDGREYRLQLDGLAAALLAPEVQARLLAMPGHPIRLAVYEWSEPGFQRLILPWHQIDTAADLETVAATLRTTRRAAAPPGTAIGPAMHHGAALLAQQPDCWKRTLDLSGDGKHNMGPHPRVVKAALEGSGLTVNALVIGADSTTFTDLRQTQIGELSAYYGAWVILGPDAFVEVALGYEDYQAAMERKLRRELEGLVLSALPTRAATQLHAPVLPWPVLPQ